jgi:hypothetical protein
LLIISQFKNIDMYSDKISRNRASGLITGVSALFLAFTGLSSLATGTGNTEEHSSYRASDAIITVTGTSTLHDWEMKSENASSEVTFIINEEGQPDDIESVIFRLRTNTLKSDKSGLDRRAYEAMNAGSHPEIIFRTNGNNNMEQKGDSYRINSSGELTVAGVTRKISVNATCVNGDDRKLVCSGSQMLKMSDFNIEPPVMMLGTLRTGDEITITYNIVYTL